MVLPQTEAVDPNTLSVLQQLSESPCPQTILEGVLEEVLCITPATFPLNPLEMPGSTTWWSADVHTPAIIQLFCRCLQNDTISRSSKEKRCLQRSRYLSDGHVAATLRLSTTRDQDKVQRTASVHCHVPSQWSGFETALLLDSLILYRGSFSISSCIVIAIANRSPDNVVV